jgi:hypothetical protein
MNRHCSTAAEAGATPTMSPAAVRMRSFNVARPLLACCLSSVKSEQHQLCA